MPAQFNEPHEVVSGNYQRAGIDQWMKLKCLRLPQRLIYDQLDIAFGIIINCKKGDGTGLYAKIFLEPLR